MGMKQTDNGKIREHFIDAMTKLHGAELRVGWFSSAKYPDGTPVPQIAALHEFGGTISVPERQSDVYFHQRADGSVGRRFVKKEKSNFAQSVKVKAHTIVIPARPFMRPAVADNRAEWRKKLGDRAKDVLQGDAPPDHMLDQFGLAVSGDIRKAITKVISPPLSPKTIKRKMRKLKGKRGPGSVTKPLVDTGLMLSSVTHEVTKK